MSAEALLREAAYSNRLEVSALGTGELLLWHPYDAEAPGRQVLVVDPRAVRSRGEASALVYRFFAERFAGEECEPEP